MQSAAVESQRSAESFRPEFIECLKQGVCEPTLIQEIGYTRVQHIRFQNILTVQLDEYGHRSYFWPLPTVEEILQPTESLKNTPPMSAFDEDGFLSNFKPEDTTDTASEDLSSSCSENVEEKNSEIKLGDRVRYIGDQSITKKFNVGEELIVTSINRERGIIGVKKDINEAYPMVVMALHLQLVTEEPTHVKCVIDLELKPRDQCILCPENHALSKDHLVNMVQYTCSKSVDTILEHEGKINCPVPGCDYHYSHWEVANNVSEKCFGKYMDMVNRVQYQNAFVKIAEDMEEQRMQKNDEEEAAENIVMQEAIRNQFRNTGYTDNEYGKSFKCPTCAFGPIDKFECDDLQTHHGEIKGGGISISNACPMCGYFAEDVTGWSYWDGTFLQGKRMRDTKQIIDDVASSFENEKKAFCEEREELMIQRNKCVASFHPLAKILDKINPNRHEHYEKFGFDDGEVCPLERSDHFTTMYQHMKSELETEDAIRSYSQNTFSRRLIHSLRYGWVPYTYDQRHQLARAEDDLYEQALNYNSLTTKMCDQISTNLTKKGYENPVTWAMYDDEEDDSYDF